MSRSAVIAVVIAIVVVAGGGILLATHNSSNKNSNDDMSNMDMSTNNTQSSSNNTDKTAANSVTIDNFAFSPANITVKKGTTVTWTNKDSATHDVTETDGQKGPDSGNLPNGKSYSFTYDTVGTFKYHCSIHPSMTGSVTVTE